MARQIGRLVAHERATPRVTARGFTLIELLIAVAIFAVVAITVYTRSGEAIRQLGALEERTLALWVAENELAAIRVDALEQRYRRCQQERWGARSRWAAANGA